MTQLCTLRVIPVKTGIQDPPLNLPLAKGRPPLCLPLTKGEIKRGYGLTLEPALDSDRGRE